jgi:hypothetical protein
MSYPWSVLGLDGPASEAEIRRAYARRLKAVRPDEDAEAFQELVDARTLALDHASAPRLEGLAAEIGAKSKGALEHAFLADDEVVRIADDEEGRIADIEQPASRGDGLPFFMATPISPPAPSMSPEHARSEGVDGIRRQLQALEKRAILQFTLSPEWSDLLKEITLLPIGDLRRLEKPLVQALARIVLSPEVFKPAPFLSRFTRTGQFRVASRFHDPGYVELLTGFDALFGWSESDMALFDILPHGEAEEFLDHLRAARRAQRVRSRCARPLVGERGLPNLSYGDLAESFSGNLLASMLTIQDEIRRTGGWPRAFSLKALLLAPLVALVNQRKLVALLWCGLVLAALILPGLGASFVGPEWGMIAAVATLLPILAALIAIHIHVANYWYRGPLARARKRIDRADQTGIFNPVLRRTYLGGHRPDLMGLPRSKPAAEGGGSYWWVFILVFLVLKLAGLFFGGK